MMNLNSNFDCGYKLCFSKCTDKIGLTKEKPFSSVIIDFRSRVFRFLRLWFNNVSISEQIRCVSGLLVSRENEENRLFDRAVRVILREIEMLGIVDFTFVFPSSQTCSYKEKLNTVRRNSREIRLTEFESNLVEFKKQLLDLSVLQTCYRSFASYVMSDLETFCMKYLQRANFLRHVVPTADDAYESDKTCVRLFKNARLTCALLSEDFDCVALFGARSIVREVYPDSFVHVFLSRVMFAMAVTTRTNLIRKCCIIGTDYNLGIKGIRCVKAKKIDESETMEKFKLCMTKQGIDGNELMKFFL